MDKQKDAEKEVIYVCVHAGDGCPSSIRRRSERSHTNGVQTRGSPDEMKKHHSSKEGSPANCRTDWVLMEELQTYDPGVHSSLIPHSKTDQKFLPGRLGGQSNMESKPLKSRIPNESDDSAAACEMASNNDCLGNGKMEGHTDIGELQIAPAYSPRTDAPAINLYKSGRLNCEFERTDMPKGRVAGSRKAIDVAQADLDKLIQPSVLPESSMTRPTRQRMAGHTSVSMLSTTAPLPSPVPPLCSAERRATEREAMAEAAKLPGVEQMLHCDPAVGLTSEWKQSPVLNTRSPQSQTLQLLPRPETSIPGLSAAGLKNGPFLLGAFTGWQYGVNAQPC